jgi:hypothetical protein
VIIDIHAHVNAPPELYAYKSGLLANRGANGKDDPGISDELLDQHALHTIELMTASAPTSRCCRPGRSSS